MPIRTLGELLRNDFAEGQAVDRTAAKGTRKARGGRGMEMPSSPPAAQAFLGVDPGIGGGMALVLGSTVPVRFSKLDGTIADAWEFVRRAGESIRVNGGFALIEEQSPRPTVWWDGKAKRWQSSILKSTCLLWGSYQQLLGMLAAAGIPHEGVQPKRWQEGLLIPKRAKPETDVQWKARLRSKAQGIFPDERVALWNADALLIAEHCRRSRAERTVR